MELFRQTNIDFLKYKWWAIGASWALILVGMFAVFVQKGHPVGSRGEVQWRHAQVGEWAEGVLVRITVYADIDEARAAAERLAEAGA